MKQIVSWGVLIALVAFPVWTMSANSTVQVGTNRLQPTEVSIAVGDTVTFHNQDEMFGGHTIVANDGSFKSPPLGKDESWSHTFDKPGTYTYHIKEHPRAKGRIVVNVK